MTPDCVYIKGHDKRGKRTTTKRYIESIMKKLRGRPARRTQAMTLRVSPETKSSYQAEASAQGMSLGDYFELQQIEIEEMSGHVRTLTHEIAGLKGIAEQAASV